MRSRISLMISAAVAILGVYLPTSYIRALLFGASNVMTGVPGYFNGAAFLVGLVGFQIGVIFGVLAVTS